MSDTKDHVVTSAQVPLDQDETPSVDLLTVPEAPDVSTMAAILSIGLPTALSSLMVAAAVTTFFVEELPNTHAASFIFALLGVVVPLMALKRYKAAFTSFEKDRKRWIALSAPAFIVIGAMAGTYLIYTIYPERDDAFWGSSICSKLNIHSGKRLKQCRPVAVSCAHKVMQEKSLATIGDALDCTRASIRD